MAAARFRKEFMDETDHYILTTSNPKEGQRSMYLHRVVKEAQKQLNLTSWASAHGAISFKVVPELPEERDFLKEPYFKDILFQFLEFKKEDNVEIFVEPSQAYFCIRRVNPHISTLLLSPPST